MLLPTNLRVPLLAVTIAATTLSCQKEERVPVKANGDMTFSFAFDSTQVRLNNLGQPSTIPAGHAGQSPKFNSMSAHYIELSKDMHTPVGQGEVLYLGSETTKGGDLAVDFDRAELAAEGEEIFRIHVTDIEPGVYNWIRVSLTYQNFDIDFKSNGLDLTATLAAFVGYNTYISDLVVKSQTLSLNENKLQGYWAFEMVSPIAILQDGQAPPGATTVPNPLFATSPIPQGSCLVTGQFEDPLVITGNETGEIEITLSVSVNKSFEFTDPNGNGIFEPDAGESPVDMGVRGLIPKVKFIQ